MNIPPTNKPLCAVLEYQKKYCKLNPSIVRAKLDILSKL